MAIGGVHSAVDWTGAVHRQPPPEVVAALDLGTNNCRLLIATAEGDGGFRVVDSFSRIVRLGEGLALSNRLCDEAVDRALAALRVCASKLRRRPPDRFRAVATEACRRAENGPAFIARVEDETGIPLEVIPAQEEARLALEGCAPLLEPLPGHAIVFDIGGGSTELVWAEVDEAARPRAIDQISLPWGVVSLTEVHGDGRMVDPSAYGRLVAMVTEELATFGRRHGIPAAAESGDVQLVGTSGTVTTLAGVHLGLVRYERSRVDGAWLGREDARAVVDKLVTMPPSARAAHPCVGRDRADLLLAGCAILDGIWRPWPVPRLRIADRGVREGILADLLR